MLSLILYLLLVILIIFSIGWLISFSFKLFVKYFESKILSAYRTWKNGETDDFSDIYWSHKIASQEKAIYVLKQPFNGELKVLAEMFKRIWLTRENKIFEEFKKIDLPMSIKNSFKYKLFKNKMNELSLHELEDIIISRAWIDDLEVK